MNELLDPNCRYESIGRTNEPIAADVYVVPDTQWGDDDADDE